MQTFYISETTLTNDIDELNKYTAYVNVKIKYSNKKGFYIEGDEYYIRNCALRLHYDSSMVKSIRREKREIKDNIVSWISEVLYKEEIAINKNSLDALTNYITQSAGNIIAGRTITSLSLIDNIEYTKDFINIAQKIYKELSQRLKINFSDEETAFLAYFLRGVLDLKNVQLSKNDPLYQKAFETIHLTNFIFNNIGINIRLNIDDDQLLRFFYGFFIRLKLDIQKREMIYLDIETTYPKSYLLSKIIFKEIAKLQNQIVAKEEAAYFSIILENLYLRQKDNSKKILSILPSEKYIADFYKYELRHFIDYNITTYNFNEYIKPDNKYIDSLGAKDTLTSDFKVHDAYRIQYLKEHIEAISEAIEDGIEVMGYLS